MKIFDITIFLILLFCMEKKFCIIEKIMNNGVINPYIIFSGIILIVALCFIIDKRILYKKFPISYNKLVKEKGKPLREFQLFFVYSRKKTSAYTKRKGSAKICVFNDCVVLKVLNRAILINSKNLVSETDFPVFINFALRLGEEVYYFKSLSGTSDIIEILNKYQ